MLTPVAFLSVVIAMITPKDDDGVVIVRACFECIENSPHHRIGIADAGEVPVNRIIDRVEFLEPSVMLIAPCDLLFSHLLR